MNRAILALFLSVLAGCASTHQPKLRGNLFSELEPGDRIHVRFASKGCFLSSDYDFEFARDTSTTVRVTSLTRTRSAAKKSFDYHSPKRLGTLTLTPRDITGLDRLIRFYRTHTVGGCTTTEDILIEHFRHIYGPTAPAMATEHYIDLSCATYGLSGVTTLPSLAERLEPKPK